MKTGTMSCRLLVSAWALLVVATAMSVKSPSGGHSLRKEPMVAPSSSRDGEPMARPSSSRVGEPMARPSSSRVSEPMARPSSSRIGEPMARPSSSRVGEPMARQSSSRDGEPMARQSSSRDGEPMARQSSSRVGEPMARQSSSRDGEPMARPSSSRDGEPQSGRHSLRSLSATGWKPSLVSSTSRHKIPHFSSAAVMSTDYLEMLGIERHGVVTGSESRRRRGQMHADEDDDSQSDPFSWTDNSGKLDRAEMKEESESAPVNGTPPESPLPSQRCCMPTQFEAILASHVGTVSGRKLPKSGVSLTL